MSYQSSITLMLHHDVCPNRLKVTAQIVQAGNVLVQEEIDLRHRTSQLHLEFELHNVTDPVLLQIKSNDSGITECPVYIDRIVLDELADIPFFVHRGQVIGTEELGNCLYSPGTLEYSFALPLMGNFGIAEKPTCSMLYEDLK